jgi:hypothetical protein
VKFFTIKKQNSTSNLRRIYRKPKISGKKKLAQFLLSIYLE